MLEHRPEPRHERLLILGHAHIDGQYTIAPMLSPERMMQRCDELARHSELAGGLTRVFLSPENRAVNDAVLRWMGEAGMQAKLDAMGNAVGRYEGEKPGL